MHQHGLWDSVFVAVCSIALLGSLFLTYYHTIVREDFVKFENEEDVPESYDVLGEVRAFIFE